jgi:hypothetical protein
MNRQRGCAESAEVGIAQRGVNLQVCRLPNHRDVSSPGGVELDRQRAMQSRYNHPDSHSFDANGPSALTE